MTDGGKRLCYVLNGQAPGDWTEYVMIEKQFKGIAGSSPIEWLSGYQQYLRENHPGDTATLIREAPDGILYEGFVKGTDEPDQEFVARNLDKGVTRFKVEYFVVAPKEMTPSLRAEWIDWLLEAWIDEQPPGEASSAQLPGETSSP